jgi:transposase
VDTGISCPIRREFQKWVRHAGHAAVFAEEYKDQAVAFVIEGNRSVADVARNIGVHEMTLGKWVEKTRDSQREQIPPDAELTGSERLELIRLRAELKGDKATIAELQMQVEFAKEVATWFAKGKQ